MRRPSVLLLVAAAVTAALVFVSTPAQALSTPTVKLSGGPYLVVDVGPDLPGTANWSFTLQRRTSTGTWAKVGTYSTTGSTEVKKLAVAAGTYRVVVAARSGYTSKTSSSYAYVPKPVVRWSGGSSLTINVDPDLPTTGSWSVTLQRLSGSTWVAAGTYATQGTAETVRALVGSGTYRAVVAKRDRFPTYTSPSYTFVYDPSVTGSYAVTTPVDVTVTRSSTSIGTTRYFPVARTGTAPLVVLLAGFQQSRSRYDGTARWLAQHGFAVVTADLGGNLFTTHSDLALNADAVLSQVLGDPAAAVVDDSRVALTGHSLGGKIAVLEAGTDARVDAVLGFDPVDGASPSVAPEVVGAMTIPMGFMGETLDSTGGGMPCAPAADNYTQFYDGAAASTRAYEWTFAGAGHFSFAEGTTTSDGFCQTPTAAKATVLAAMRTLSTAFLNRHLRGDATQAAWLTGTKVGTGTLGIVSAVTKP